MSKKVSKIFLFSFLALFCFFIFSFFVIAEGRELEVEYPEIAGIKPETVETPLPDYVKYVFSFAVAIAGLILFGVLVAAGVLYLISTDQPQKKKEAKERIISGFLGIIILLSAVLIFYQINPRFFVFHLPPLPAPKKVEVRPPVQIKPEEVALITLELPLGQMIDNVLWSKKKETELLNLINNNEAFLKEKIKTGERTFETISDLTKYLESLVRECRCEELKGLCTTPENFAMPIGCSGDPCPEKTRKEIDEILKIIQEKQKKLNEFAKNINGTVFNLIDDLYKHIDVEEKVYDCQGEGRSLSTLAEHLTTLNYFEEHGLKLKRITLPAAPKSVADPLNFYCPVGGIFFDYLRQPAEILPTIPPEIVLPEFPGEVGAPIRLSCPVEIPLGEVVDGFREATVNMVLKLERISYFQNDLAVKLEKLSEYVAQCSDKNCKVNCCCVPNPCYQMCCPGPCCPPKLCAICVPFCKSPCLQAPGGCYGEPCPVDKIKEVVEEIKKIEDKPVLPGLFQEIRKAREIFHQVSLMRYSKENPKNLKNVREAMRFCFSRSIEAPTWQIMTCDEAVGNFGPDGQIMSNCHPRNLYCCTGQRLDEIALPWEPPQQFKEPLTIIPAQKIPPLPAGKDGCPQGWRCNPGIGRQYLAGHASEPLKELLSCARKKLDAIQEERGIKHLGRITSISDSNLFTGECKWETGMEPHCAHTYTKYRVSCHYGGRNCRYQRKSYAVDIGARPGEYGELIKQVFKECNKGAFVKIHDPGPHLHVSIGAVQKPSCGCL